ncbi:MAG: histidine phosphatase family protein [Paracoccaceae bacterium]
MRHGKTVSPGTLNGRTDVALAARPAPVTLEPFAVWVSPARRARETAAGLFPKAAIKADDRLWEQDFGRFDGVAFADLPDLGALSKADLADHTPEGGESFQDMAARATPALREAADLALGAERPVVVVAHAGILRAALAMAMEAPAAALAFQIDYLGAVRLLCLDDGFAIMAVNERLS